MANKRNIAAGSRQSRFFVLSITVSVLLSIISLVSYFSGVSSVLSNFVSIVVSPINQASSAITQKISSIGNYFGDIAELKDENLRLQAENDELLKLNDSAKAIREENEHLYAYLELKREFSSLSLANARIISRGSTGIMTTFTIDKGTLHGVKKDMPVISHNGIVGIVTEEGLATSRCISIINHKSSVGIYILRNGTPGVLSGDYTLSLDGKCKVSGLASDSDVLVGDYVYTSGYGEIFPKDLCVGTVSAVVRDANTHTLILEVLPMSNLDSLDTVMVITGYERIYEDSTPNPEKDNTEQK